MQLCYESATHTALEAVMNQLKKLFHFQPKAAIDETLARAFEDIHHAYGLLLSQCQEIQMEDVQKQFEQVCKTSLSISVLMNL